MSYEYRNIDALRTSYLKNIDTYECLLKAWDAVTFNYKKDGGHFANLQKNFNGARVYQCRYSIRAEEKELSVTCCTSKSGYQSDAIALFERKYGSKYDDPSRPLTVDEIIEKIQQRKAQIAGYIVGYQYKLDNLDKLQGLMDSVQKQVSDLPKELQHDATSMLKEYYFHAS